MSLSKVNAAASNTSVEEILVPESGQEIVMGIDPRAMSHIIARLTDMYPDPVAATVREIVSNATDATVLVPENERKPIEITRPTSLEPVFKVVDHGVGMSLDQIKEIYSQYGSSTKQTDFTQIGAYGLGAKAPLAYCTEFSVKTTQDGVTVDVLLSRKSEGNVTKIVSVERTGLPSGTVVMIPVRNEDILRFDEALNSYREYSFHAPVNIDGIIYQGNPDYVDFGELPIHYSYDENGNRIDDSVIMGRAWVLKKDLVNLARNINGNEEFNFVYSLSGWGYKNKKSNSYYRSWNVTPVIEIKPGIVDFSSGRDEITTNARSEELERLVSSYFKTMQSVILDKVKEKYRELTDVEAINFVIALKDYLNPYNTNGIGIKNLVNFSVTDLETESGFNPASLFEFDGASTARIVLEKYKSNSFHVYDELSLNRSYYSGVTSYRHLRSTITRNTVQAKKTSVFESVIEKQSSLGSLADVMRSMILNSTHSNNSQQKLTETSHFAHVTPVVITGLNENNFNKFMSSRKSLFDYVYTENEKLIIADSTSGIKKMRELASYVGITVQVETADNLIEKVRIERKKNAVPVERRKNLGREAEISASVFKITEHTEKDKDYSLIFKETSKAIEHVYTKETFTVQDIKDNDYVVILTEKYSVYNKYGIAREVLFGAINAGERIENRDVLLVSVQDRQLNAAILKELEHYDGTLAHSSFRYNAKVADKIKETRTFHATILDSTLKNLSDKEIIRNYIYNHRDLKIFENLCGAWIKVSGNGNEFIEKINFIHDAVQTTGSEVFKIDEEFIKKSSIDSELIVIVDVIREAISYNNYNQGMFKMVLQNVLQYHDILDVNDSFVKKVLRALLEEIETKVTEIEKSE